MFASTINLTIFIMMVLIYFNEMRNVSMFAFNFTYIKDLSKIIMEQKCNNIYCEAETDRYQIAKNSYKLLLPNDVFNSKTYTIMVFIISIMIFIYYYYLLFDTDIIETRLKYLNMFHIFILFTILICVIILRYAPNDEAGYLNYFRDFKNPIYENNALFYWFTKVFYYMAYGAVGTIFLLLIMIKWKQLLNKTTFFPTVMKILCYMLSLILVFNLMNIVMTFRINIKPILKTKQLAWSLELSFKNRDENFTDVEKEKLGSDILNEYQIFTTLKDNISSKYTKGIKDKNNKYSTSEETLSYIINIYIAFNELADIVLKDLHLSEKDIDKKYIAQLKTTIKNNYDILVAGEGKRNDAKLSNVSLIYDKTVRIPFIYDNDNKNEHDNNDNTNNIDYIYTADISYDSPNLFYEKYWNINDDFLLTYDYFVPTMLSFYRPNLYKILNVVIMLIIFICIALHPFAKLLANDEVEYSLFTILQPFVAFVILIIFILLFISFNTWFNKYVVYKCLDCSYKRSLNKLNNIVTPYIRIYNNKIIMGNKTYIHHYIIANVFYSILTGNIKFNQKSAIDVSAVKNRNDVVEYKEANINEAYEEAHNVNNYTRYLLAELNIIINMDKSQEITKSRIAVIKSLLDIQGYFKIIKDFATSAETKTKAAYGISADLTLSRELIDLNKQIADLTSSMKSINSIYIFKNALASGGDLHTRITSLNAMSLMDLDPIYLAVKSAIGSATAAVALAETVLIDAELAKDNALKYFLPLSVSRVNEEEDNKKYYDTSIIKTNRFKFANMNNSILSNDNQFREYYKDLYNNIYKETYNDSEAKKLYRVFKNIFSTPAATIATDALIDSYFKTNIITKDETNGTLSKIYFIIKKCIELFNEEKFNNNLIYYNNYDNKQKDININSYDKFKFIKQGDKIIPYKFILKLNTIAEYNDFVKDTKTVAKAELNKNLSDYFDIKEGGDLTKILEDKDEEDLLSQASDIDKMQDKNLIKIIAKYLLILGHINYNRIEYNATSNVTLKEKIYTRKSYYLYKLFSNILYDDTYKIDDTFDIRTYDAIKDEERLNVELQNTTDVNYLKYSQLTYIYNYLETKYVVISPSSNKNYLQNIIMSINNKINDDDKIFDNKEKNARYLFRDKIDKTEHPDDIDNEDDILNVANNMSTSVFGAIYLINIIIMTLFFYIISSKVKKTF